MLDYLSIYVQKICSLMKQIIQGREVMFSGGGG